MLPFGEVSDKSWVTLTKLISLTQGMSALVDDEDFAWASQWKWCAHKKVNTCYAVRTVRLPDNKNLTLSMHRALLIAPEGLEIDHINGNGLDNRRENLRFVTHQQNQYNRPAKKNNKSGYKGVSWDKRAGKWLAGIYVDGKNRYLGLFTNVQDAAVSYDAAARELHGEFAQFNFPGDV